MKAKQGESLQSFINHRWHKMRERVSTNKYYKNIEIQCTRDEFAAWVKLNWATVLDLRSRGKVPSIDRKNSQGHYNLNNMQIICTKENSAKGRDLGNKMRTAKKRKQYPPKECPICNKIFDKRVGEPWRDYKHRNYCSNECRNKTRRRNHRGQFETNDNL